MVRAARAPWSDRRVAVALAALTLLKGIFWIALIPIFKVADEPSHFENAQYRAEYFKTPQYVPGEKMETTVHTGAPQEVRTAWVRTNQLFENRYVEGIRQVRTEVELAEMAKNPANRRGSGQISSWNYPGFYYNLGAIFYEPFRRASVLVRIEVLRMMSLMFGILAVVATFFAARLIMSSRALAVAAAVIVMLQPMESQMTAAVNNDAGVIGLAAVLFYLQVRFLVRAPEIPRWRWGALMAVVAGLAIHTKPQGFAMLPGCAFCCLVILVRNWRTRAAWIFAVTTAVIAVLLLASYLVPQWTAGHSIVPARAADASSVLPRGSSPDFLTFLDAVSNDAEYKQYLLRSFFGQFGWMEFSIVFWWTDAVKRVWLLVEIGVVVAVTTRILRGPRRSWMSFRGFLFSGFTAIFTVLFILFAEHRFRQLGEIGVIQGRNMLFGLPALAIVAAAAYGAMVPARFRTLSAAALVTSAVCLHAAAILVIVRQHYGS